MQCRDPKRREALARSFHGHIFDTVESRLRSDILDLVYVGSPCHLDKRGTINCSAVRAIHKLFSCKHDDVDKIPFARLNWRNTYSSSLIRTSAAFSGNSGSTYAPLARA